MQPQSAAACLLSKALSEHSLRPFPEVHLVCTTHLSTPTSPTATVSPTSPPSFNELFSQLSFPPCLHSSVMQALRAWGNVFTDAAGHKQQFNHSTLRWHTSVSVVCEAASELARAPSHTDRMHQFLSSHAMCCVPLGTRLTAACCLLCAFGMCCVPAGSWATQFAWHSENPNFGPRHTAALVE